MVKLKQKIKELPKGPGVYVFKDRGGGILYIGKAKELQKRVKSHFQSRAGFFGKNILLRAKDIDWIETDSEREALILEQQMIKRFQPRFNIEWQDGKNYFFVGITQEDFPRIFITHQRKAGARYLGPFVQGRELKKFLKEIRKIMPYRSCRILPKQPCLYYDLGLCLAPCLNKRRKKKYQKMIETFKVLLEIYLGRDSPPHQTGAERLWRSNWRSRPPLWCGGKRIEGYDISNISGTMTVGSMVVFEKTRPKKSDYRKFRIKRVKGQNDVKALREVLLRRMRHSEWNMPDLILLDGGKGQLSAARKIDIPVIALAKRKKYSGKLFSLFSKNFVLIDNLPENIKNLFLQVRDEAHRFAVTFHKKRRKKHLLE